MPRCKYLVFDLPDNDESNRAQGKFYCEKSDHRLSADTLAHVCDCIYEDKFLNCEFYQKENE